MITTQTKRHKTVILKRTNVRTWKKHVSFCVKCVLYASYADRFYCLFKYGYDAEDNFNRSEYVALVKVSYCLTLSETRNRLNTIPEDHPCWCVTVFITIKLCKIFCLALAYCTQIQVSITFLKSLSIKDTYNWRSFIACLQLPVPCLHFCLCPLLFLAAFPFLKLFVLCSVKCLL